MDKTKTQLYKVGKKNILEYLETFYKENKHYGAGIKVDVSELNKWIVDNKTYYYLCTIKRPIQKYNRNLIYICEDTEDNSIEISFVQEKRAPRALINNKVIKYLREKIDSKLAEIQEENTNNNSN